MDRNTKWAGLEDVKQRLGSANTAKGYLDTDIRYRIVRAEDRIRGQLQSYVSASVIAIWIDEETVPRMVNEWVSDLAAAFMFADFFGQSLMDKGSQAGSLYLKVEDDLKKLRAGELTLVDTAGVDIPASEDLISSTKTNRTPTFSATHKADSDFGDGSLDEF